jgi:flagellum-specific peptidoglycan hydrolase FlgJ
MLTKEQLDFLKDIALAAVASEAETDVPAELTTAQAILETGWGRYMPPNSNNLFGIKDTDRYPGASYAMTTEWIKGSPVKIQAAFEKYPSLQACISDHARLISSAGVYAPHYQVYKTDRDSRGYLWGIAAHYATDPGYARKVWRIMQMEELQREIQLARSLYRSQTSEIRT